MLFKTREFSVNRMLGQYSSLPFVSSSFTCRGLPTTTVSSADGLGKRGQNHAPKGTMAGREKELSQWRNFHPPLRERRREGERGRERERERERERGETGKEIGELVIGWSVFVHIKAQL